jgi:membrane-bound lytic murein transglycosylase D
MMPTNGVDRAALDRYAQRAAANYVAPASTAGKKKIVYKVKSGDTLGDIAAQYHTSVDRIRSWNDLSRRKHIYAGQRLAIYVNESYQQAESRDTASTTAVVVADESRFEKTKHVVARGESLYSISKQFNVSVPDLMSWNGLSRSSIKSGDVIVIWTPRAPVEARMP